MTRVPILVPTDRLQDCADAYRFFAKDLLGCSVETLRVAHLDAEGGVIGVSAAGEGTADAIELPIRTIVADAIAWGSASLVLAHNHPSGDPTPSRADIAATRDLAAAARPLGIRIQDHLVIATGGWRSFRALGLL